MLARRIAITAAVLALAWRALVWTSLEPTPLAVALGIMGLRKTNFLTEPRYRICNTASSSLPCSESYKNASYVSMILVSNSGADRCRSLVKMTGKELNRP